jgi:hypothetical protein
MTSKVLPSWPLTNSLLMNLVFELAGAFSDGFRRSKSSVALRPRELLHLQTSRLLVLAGSRRLKLDGSHFEIM